MHTDTPSLYMFWFILTGKLSLWVIFFFSFFSPCIRDMVALEKESIFSLPL